MTTITARIPIIDWQHGFERHWNGGNPAVTHAFNAQSFFLTQAKQFCIVLAKTIPRSLDINRFI